MMSLPQDGQSPYLGYVDERTVGGIGDAIISSVAYD